MNMQTYTNADKDIYIYIYPMSGDLGLYNPVLEYEFPIGTRRVALLSTDLEDLIIIYKAIKDGDAKIFNTFKLYSELEVFKKFANYVGPQKKYDHLIIGVQRSIKPYKFKIVGSVTV